MIVAKKISTTAMIVIGVYAVLHHGGRLGYQAGFFLGAH